MSPTSPEERAALIESAASAFRAREAASGRVLPSPSWMDLSPADCDELFDRQLESRILERGLDLLGLSATARAVMSRVRLDPWSRDR